MSVKHHFLDGSALILLDERGVVLLLMEYQFRNLLGHIGIREVEHIALVGTVVFQIDLAIRQHVGRSRVLENIDVAFLAEAVNVRAALDLAVRHLQLIVFREIGIVGPRQRDMIGGTGTVGMQKDDVAHGHFLNGAQDDPTLFLVHTQHLMGIDGQQTQSVEIELALRLVGSEGVAFGEP